IRDRNVTGVQTCALPILKSIEAGVLSSVFKIHDRARGAVYKLCEVFLCPAFGFSFALDFPAQRVKIKFSFILVHFHLTPILFYRSEERRVGKGGRSMESE